MANQVLQEIKDKLDVAEVIGSYITIKKAGVNFKAVCPFHSEKSPSLVVSPQKQIWHCFGCGEGGDVFGFVMRYENLEFRDALKLLATRAGVVLPTYQAESKQQVDEREQLLRINDFAARIYHEMLVKNPGGKTALDYLHKRGLTNQTIEQWRIGFAPEDFHFLEQLLVKKKVTIDHMIKAGVSVKGERGGIYDRFRGRITFPVFNSVGDVVGFSARVLQGDEKTAKYINSPETAVYNKSKVLFGFNFAKNGIRKADEAIIVEGQMDCISAHQAGFANVVASSGTALSPEHLTQIGRFTKNLKFCFDSDAAGLLATRRAAEQYLGKGFLIKIINLKGAKDPDELIRKNPKDFAKQVAAAPLVLDFLIDKVFQSFNGSLESKKKVEAELLPLLVLLTDPLERDHYVRLLSEKMGVTPHVFLEKLNQFKSNKSIGHSVVKPEVRLPSGPNALEKMVLGGMLLYPEFVGFIKEQGGAADFVHPEARALADSVLKGRTIDPNNLLATEAIFMVESESLESEGGDPAVMRQLKKSFAQLRLTAIKEQQKEITAQLPNIEATKQTDKLQELNQQFAELSKQRFELEKFL